jgi:hypothetical protein
VKRSAFRSIRPVRRPYARAAWLEAPTRARQVARPNEPPQGGLERAPPSVRTVVDRRVDDSDQTTQDDEKRREVSASVPSAVNPERGRRPSPRYRRKMHPRLARRRCTRPASRSAKSVPAAKKQTRTRASRTRRGLRRRLGRPGTRVLCPLPGTPFRLPSRSWRRRLRRQSMARWRSAGRAGRRAWRSWLASCELGDSQMRAWPPSTQRGVIEARNRPEGRWGQRRQGEKSARAKRAGGTASHPARAGRSVVLNTVRVSGRPGALEEPPPGAARQPSAAGVLPLSPRPACASSERRTARFAWNHPNR